MNADMLSMARQRHAAISPAGLRNEAVHYRMPMNVHGNGPRDHSWPAAASIAGLRLTRLELTTPLGLHDANFKHKAEISSTTSLFIAQATSWPT